MDLLPDLPPSFQSATLRLKLSATTGVPSLWQKVQVIPQASIIFTLRLTVLSTTLLTAVGAPIVELLIKHSSFSPNDLNSPVPCD